MARTAKKHRPMPEEGRKLVAKNFGSVERYRALCDSLGYRQLRLPGTCCRS